MTTVVGGTYVEECIEPAVQWVFGSGVRGARVLRGIIDRFITVASDEDVVSASTVLPGIRIEASRRPSRIRFLYETAMSPPRLFRDGTEPVALADVEDDSVVVYGMVESMPAVRGRRVVLDPQHSLRLEIIPELVTADELIVIANSREIRRLAGCENLSVAARSVLEHLNARAVVVKGGAAGAVVVTADTEAGVTPIVTNTVFPIGSGDVFTAAFAAGLFGGLDLDDAASAASERTASYCATRQLSPVVIDPLFELPVPTLTSLGAGPKVYVAASFATPAQRWLGRTIAGGIDDIGGRSVYPLRDVGPVQDQAVTATSDLDALDGCDAVLVVADEARSGPHFEGGWAMHAGIPVVVMSSDEELSRFTMLRGTGAPVVHDIATACYRVVWEGLRRRGQRSG